MNQKPVCRLRRSRKQIDSLLAAFDSQEISAHKFARQQGIPPASFANWLRRRRTPPPKSPHWIELIPPTPASTISPTVCLELPDGVKVHWAPNIPVAAVAELITLLRRP